MLMGKQNQDEPLFSGAAADVQTGWVRDGV